MNPPAGQTESAEAATALNSARRILVATKFRYLGDSIVATPFLQRLKEGVPAAEVTLLAGPAIPELLRGCPYLAGTIPFSHRDARGLAPSLALARNLRAARFDTVFLINRSIHSALIARLARIPRRIGFDTEYRGSLLTDRVAYDWTKPDRDCALDLLRSAGVPAEPGLPKLWVTDAEKSDARLRLQTLGADPDALVVGMQPGANDPEVREWGAERFASVAGRLQAEHGAQIVLFGAKDERGTSDRVAEKMSRPPLILTGETGLREALALISHCGLWIGNDGGLLHAAVALGPATVGIFGPTKAPRWGYDTLRHRTMVATIDADVRANDAAAIRRSLDAVSVESVYREAAILLEKRP